MERRADVLIYSTPLLAQDLEVTGPIRLELFASSSAVDTDFTAKLVDVGRMASRKILPKESSVVDTAIPNCSPTS